MSDDGHYHIPVLADEVCNLMITNKHGIYLDGTLGGGGHFDALGKRLAADATLIGIDRDPDAIAFNKKREHECRARILIEQCRFSEVAAVLVRYSITAVDGILLDLGISSFQIDQANRGFSFMQPCNLDMRMNPNEGVTAADLIESLSVGELAGVLENYGEIRNADRMARAIKGYGRPMYTSTELKECLTREYSTDLKYKILAKVFMALRIAVNDELNELRKMLQSAIKLLCGGGRIAVLTYHSLEDRIVKEFFRSHEPHCICPRVAHRCTCGLPGELKRITKKSVTAAAQEIAGNPRSRSAALRVAEKLKEFKNE